jgi:hypothetical protein
MEHDDASAVSAAREHRWQLVSPRWQRRMRNMDRFITVDTGIQVQHIPQKKLGMVLSQSSADIQDLAIICLDGFIYPKGTDTSRVVEPISGLR